MKDHANNVALILLLSLVAIMYFFTEEAAASVGLILGLGALKFGLVALQFMEVKKAHPVYGMWLLLLFAGYAVGAIWLLPW